MTYASEEKPAHMALWLTLLVVALHLKTFFWLSHTVHEDREKTLLPIEVTLVTLPKPVSVEPEKPKPIVEPEKKLPPPKPKSLPKPEVKPEPKPVVKPKPASKPVQINTSVQTEIPVTKEAAPAPVAVAPAQAVSTHQAPAASSPANGTGHAKVAANGDDTEADAYIKGTPLHTPQPRYPNMAKSRHLEGKVVLIIKVNAEGEVVDVSIEKSSGHEILDEAAKDGAQSWTFNPARRGGKAVAATYTRPIDFKLSE